MSTAATATEVPVAAPAKGKKKLIIILIATVPVSYTHLDVYKRQTSLIVMGSRR